MFLAELCSRQDHAAARSAESLMSCGRHNMGIRERARMYSGSYQTCNVCDVRQQVRADFIRDLAESLEVDGPSVSAGSADDQLRPALFRDTFHLIIIDEAVLPDAIGNYIEISSGEVRGASVREMSSFKKIHSHVCVALLQKREFHSHVCLCAGVRLYISPRASEQLFGSFPRDILDIIDNTASTVKTTFRKSFRIFIRKRASHSCHDSM